MIKKNVPTETFTIGDLDTLRVVADPLRNQIVELLIMEPLTVKQVAERLGLAPSKLYYHIGLLEKHGIIEVAETRMVANLQEKDYRAVAHAFHIAPELLSFGTSAGRDTISSLIISTMDTTREDFLRTVQARALSIDQGKPEQLRRAVLTRETARVPESRLPEFIERLETLIKDFGAANSDDDSEPHHNYAFTIAFYPSLYFSEE